MTARTISDTQTSAGISTSRWLQIGLLAAAASIVAVLLIQAAILSISPDLAAFKPLDSYARSALFTFIPAMAATGVFAWLVKSQDQPVTKFLGIAAIVLLLSFIPDFLLPVPNRTLEGSLAAAALHLAAGIVTVALLLVGYARSTGKTITK